MQQKPLDYFILFREEMVGVQMIFYLFLLFRKVKLQIIDVNLTYQRQSHSYF